MRVHITDNIFLVNDTAHYAFGHTLKAYYYTTVFRDHNKLTQS